MAAVWKEIGQVQTSASAEGFYSGIAVLVNKPHVINRRLCGAKILNQWHVHVDCGVFLSDILTLDPAEDREGILLTVSEACQRCTTTNSDAISCAEITLRELLPKEMHRFPLLTEVVLIDPERCTASFVPVRVTGGQAGPREPCLPAAYRLQLNPGERRLSVSLHTESAKDESQGLLGCSPEWLRTTLLPKLAQWGEEPKLNTEVTSLKLVPIDKYNDKYQDMKVRYGRQLVQTWPEATDPRKFVYEDIAIAAYLLVLWEEEQHERGMKKQSFVDLGCGNGLLVHLLNSEGYPGVGIDVRRRKIWDKYGPETNLQECTITPSDSHLFPEYDWILGNHSDELTPWIPVIAARSSHECSYFVLPCCHWDFAGKFCLKEAGTSQYRTYLEFVRSVGETCGFRVREDTLRIPSTKRVCFVGSQRTYTEESQGEKCSQIQAYIDLRCQRAASQLCKSGSRGAKNGDLPTIPCMTPAGDPDVGEGPKEVGKEQNWAEDFRVRSVVETSRNCVDVDRGVIDRIVKRVFDELLADPAAESKTLADGCLWNAGGRIPLADIATWFDGPTLLHLKSECGGLQTLLRNKHQIFQVSGGCVQLRDWTRVSEHDKHQMTKKKRKGNSRNTDPTRVTKTQLCYFHVYHPEGCLLPAELCRFAHGTDELRPGTSDLRPHINHHRPGTVERRASTDELRPGTSDLRPHTNHHRPGTDECQASTDELRPDTGELRPDTDEVPPEPIDFKPTPSYADR